MAIKKKMQMGGKAKPMGGEVGAYSKLKGKDLALEKSRYKTFGDGPGSGPSGAMPKPKKKMGGAIKKAQTGAKVKSDMQAAPKKKAAVSPTGTFRSQSMNAPKMAKSGGSFPDLNKDGKVTQADILKGRGVIAKKGAAVKKCKYGCK